MSARFSPDWKRLVLRIVHDALNQHPDDPKLAYLKYVDLSRAVVDLLDVNNGEINSVRVMLSRTVHSLVDEGMLIGWYRTWFKWQGQTQPVGGSWFEDGFLNGETPWAWEATEIRRPRLVWLQLSEKGKRFCRQTIGSDREAAK